MARKKTRRQTGHVGCAVMVASGVWSGTFRARRGAGTGGASPHVGGRRGGLGCGELVGELGYVHLLFGVLDGHAHKRRVGIGEIVNVHQLPHGTSGQRTHCARFGFLPLPE